MKAREVLMWGGLIGVGFLLLRQQLGRFSVGNPSIDSLRLEPGGVLINVKLPIVNRSDIAVPISGFIGVLTYNGTQIGTTYLNQATIIQPRSVSAPVFGTHISMLSVLTSTPLLSLLNSLAQKYLGISIPGIPANKPLEGDAIAKYLGGLRLTGTVYAANLSIDIDKPLTA